MPATELFIQLIGINLRPLTASEIKILEVDFFTRICDELNGLFKELRQDYYLLMKLNDEMEEIMLNANLLRDVVNDILITEEYSLNGIALYTQSHVDVIFDIASGKNQEPSLPLARKILNLHKSVRPNLYREIMKKIINEYAIS